MKLPHKAYITTSLLGNDAIAKDNVKLTGKKLVDYDAIAFGWEKKLVIAALFCAFSLGLFLSAAIMYYIYNGGF